MDNIWNYDNYVCLVEMNWLNIYGKRRHFHADYSAKLGILKQSKHMELNDLSTR